MATMATTTESGSLYFAGMAPSSLAPPEGGLTGLLDRDYISLIYQPRAENAQEQGRICEPQRRTRCRGVAGLAMKTYRGERTIDGIKVTVDGQPLPTHEEVRRFSALGFEWSYEGLEPAQLALAILVDHSAAPSRRSKHATGSCGTSS